MSEQNVAELPFETASQGNDHENAGGSGDFELDENGERVPHGMGQSKSSRRRRRKRKGKTTDAATPQGGTDNVAASPAVTATEVPAAPQAQTQAPPQNGGGFRQNGGQGRGYAGQQNGAQQNGAQQNGSGQNGAGQNAPGGTKRWKKKFRDRERPRTDGGQQNFGGSNNGGAPQQNGSSGGGFRGPDTHQPGNSVAGFKRKGGFGGKQQRNGGSNGGGRGGFVGPMDHSYRVANGNVFDGPPATIDSYGNGNGGGGRGRSYQSDSQPIDYSMGRVVPIAEGTPTHIYLFIDDLFFTAKIQETARKLGVKVAFVKNEKEQIATLTSGEESDRPGLIVFDLNNASAKPLTLIPKLKSKLKKTTSIIGFLSHLQGDLKAKAVEAGCDTVMPRAAFSQNLPNLLRRYGLEEAEETNFNQ